MKNRRKNILLIAAGIVLLLVLLILSIRLLSPREIDDVSSENYCDEKYLEKADILWVTPKFNNKSISENKIWCEYILSMNKSLGLHGVTHEYEEFEKERNQEYLDEGIKIFEDCFNQTPTMFKPPQLKISKGNKNLIKNNNMKLEKEFNQIIHKVYHCNDSGRPNNKWNDWI